MKINIILPFTSLTGGIRVIYLYANYLTEQGHDVICYVPMLSYKFNMNKLSIFKNTIKNCLLYKKDSNWFDCNFNIISVPSINNKFVRNADITIATAWPTANDVYNLNKSKGEKVYFIQAYETFSGPKNKVDKTYMLGLNNITISKELQNFLKNEFGTDSTLIYNGLSSSEFITQSKEKKKVVKIMMLASEDENKGLKEGLNILNKIMLNYKIEVTLFGINTIDYIPKTYVFYKQPERKKLIELYKNADIYLFTSKYESWGLPVLEAMSNKCAVVGMNTGVLTEIGINKENCILCENYEQLYTGIITLLNNTDLLKKIQENGFKTATQFSWENSFIMFENYLKGLLNEK